MKKQLVKLMDAIENPGQFSTSGELNAVYPGLQVKNVGTISLPLPKQQAKDIISQCEQAPFGRREETIVDTKVRKVWQMSPKNFKLTNPQWEIEIEKEVNNIAKELGLYKSQINSELYKLLVYEKGSFFTPHRDTEKLPNMFATMIVNLPSSHQGGELIINHGNESTKFSFAESDGFNPEYVAFYADCQHEVSKVKSGYRLSLVYNLALAKRKRQPQYSDQKKAINKVSQFINSQEDSSPIVYLLDHAYTEENLCLNNLKNGDLSKVSALFQAGENTYDSYLCLVSFYEESYGDYHGNSYNKKNEKYFTCCDVEDSEVYAHNLITKDNEKLKIKKLSLEEDDLIAKIPIDSGPGREVHISEATGNEGATKELWYHRGAVMLWPKKNFFDFLEATDLNFISKNLNKLAKNKDNVQKYKPQMEKMVNKIMDEYRYGEIENIYRTLLAISNLELSKKYVTKKIENIRRTDPKNFIKFVEKLGWHNFAEEIIIKLADDCKYSAEDTLEWFFSIIKHSKTLLTEQKPGIVASFERLWLVVQSNISGRAEERVIKTIKKVIQLSDLINDKTTTKKIISNFEEQSAETTISTIIPAIMQYVQGNKKTTSNLDLFVSWAISSIENNFQAPPKKPSTWSRTGNIDCECQYCKEINLFLPDKNERKIVIDKTLKRNLLHLEEKIQKHDLDLDIEIIRNGSKFTGFFYKNTGSYDYDMNQYNTAQKMKNKINTDFYEVIS